MSLRSFCRGQTEYFSIPLLSTFLYDITRICDISNLEGLLDVIKGHITLSRITLNFHITQKSYYIIFNIVSYGITRICDIINLKIKKAMRPQQNYFGRCLKSFIG